MITVILAFLVGILVFVVIWVTVKRNTARLWGQNAPMTFTPPGFKPALEEGALRFGENGYLVQVPTGDFVSFEPRHERYTKIAEVVIALASASIVFVPNSRLNVYPHSCAFALVLLGFSIVYALGFMAALTYFYEDFLYRPNSYSPGRYGLVHALGFGAFACFALAYILLAARIGWALIYSSNPFVKIAQ